MKTININDSELITADDGIKDFIALAEDYALVLRRQKAKFASADIDNPNRAFFTKAFFRPALDGENVGGAMAYVGSKSDDGSFSESLRQTMKTDQELDYMMYHDPHFFSPNRIFSHKTEIERFAEKGNKGRNTYVSVGLFWGNAFKNGGRLVKNIKSVDRFVLDIDGPDHRILTKKEKKMISAEVQKRVGAADFVVDSGSGLQLHYLFEERTDIFAIEKAYDYIENIMCKRAEESIHSVPRCHVDKLKMNSFYRLPLTFNQRSQSKVKVMTFNDLEPLNFDCLVRHYKCEDRDAFAKSPKKQHCKKINSSKNRYTFGNYASDLEHDYLSLASVYGSEGCRNKMLYYYLYNIQCAVKDEDSLSIKADLLNKTFKKPLPDYEVSCILRSSMSEYNIHKKIFSLESQLNKIGISPKSVTNLGLKLPVSFEDKKERKRQAARKQGERRKELRHNQKLEKINRTLALYQKGLTIQKISEATGVCRQTVSKWIKEYA